MTNIQLRDNLKQQFLEILSSKKSGGSISVAASLVGVSRQSIYDWRRQDNTFERLAIQAMQEGKSQIADIAEQGLIKRIESGDTTAIIFTLKTLRSSHYGDGEERRQQEKRLNEKTPEAAAIREPIQVVLKTSMIISHLEHLASQAEMLTPEIVEMFEKLKVTVKHYEEVLK